MIITDARKVFVSIISKPLVLEVNSIFYAANHCSAIIAVLYL